MKTSSGVRTPLYKRWWFWVVVLFLIIAVWYARGYFMWAGQMAGYAAENQARDAYWKVLEVQSNKIEAEYRADTYGGDTPEETLAMYVKALEAGDLELAAKYYIPEEQKQELASLREANELGHINEFLEVLGYKNKVSVGQDGDVAAVDFFLAGEQYHVIFLKLNPFTKKWKLFSNK